MSKRISKAELRKLVEQAWQHNMDFIATMEMYENPQVIKMVTDARGQAEAFYAVLQALNGDAVLLKIHTGGY